MSAAIRLKPVSLPMAKRRELAVAYEGGRMSTEVLANQYQRGTPGSRLAILPQAPLKPVHFSFTGNRPYRMQMVSNGEALAIASQQSGTRDPGSVRLEVIEHSELDFALVKAPPTAAQIRRLYADWLAYLVQGFDQAVMTEEIRNFWISLSCPLGMGKTMAAALREQDAYQVLGDYIDGR